MPIVILKASMKHDLSFDSKRRTRRTWLRDTTTEVLRAALVCATGGSVLQTLGCVSLPKTSVPDLIWGRHGTSDGRFVKPRAIAIDRSDQLYICDTTGRIQVFDTDGNFQRVWVMPETANGRPTGMQLRPADKHVDRELLLVADTHYYRMLAFELDGTLHEDACIGGTAGFGPGEFAFVTEAVTDQDGGYYIGEYGDSDRIQRFDPNGAFVSQWGKTGRDPGEFVRPQSMIAHDRNLYVMDSGNDRVQVFDLTSDTPRLVDVWGQHGKLPGQLSYPYDVTLQFSHERSEQGAEPHLLICEYLNQRVQQTKLDGTPVATWGAPGRGEGQLNQPWGAVVDSLGRIHVLDSNNHRVQRVAANGMLPVANGVADLVKTAKNPNVSPCEETFPVA
ncbi:MAG: 6-bladed beta-propeller [Planctomycetota bacterium]